MYNVQPAAVYQFSSFYYVDRYDSLQLLEAVSIGIFEVITSYYT